MYIPSSPFGYCPSSFIPQEGICSECGRRMAYELSLRGTRWIPCTEDRHEGDRRRIVGHFLRILEMHVNGWTQPPEEYWLVERRISVGSWTPVSYIHRRREDALELLEERRGKHPQEAYRMVHVEKHWTVEDV